MAPRSQTLTLDTIAGPRPLPAPDGWNFDETATIVWSRLLGLTRERRKPTKLKRDAFVLDGQIEVLANILASSIGMASFYWQREAQRFAA